MGLFDFFGADDTPHYTKAQQDVLNLLIYASTFQPGDALAVAGEFNKLQSDPQVVNDLFHFQVRAPYFERMETSNDFTLSTVLSKAQTGRVKVGPPFIAETGVPITVAQDKRSRDEYESDDDGEDEMESDEQHGTSPSKKQRTTDNGEVPHRLNKQPSRGISEDEAMMHKQNDVKESAIQHTVDSFSESSRIESSKNNTKRAINTVRNVVENDPNLTPEQRRKECSVLDQAEKLIDETHTKPSESRDDTAVNIGKVDEPKKGGWLSALTSPRKAASNVCSAIRKVGDVCASVASSSLEAGKIIANELALHVKNNSQDILFLSLSTSIPQYTIYIIVLQIIVKYYQHKNMSLPAIEDLEKGVDIDGKKLSMPRSAVNKLLAMGGWDGVKKSKFWKGASDSLAKMEAFQKESEDTKIARLTKFALDWGPIIYNVAKSGYTIAQSIDKDTVQNLIKSFKDGDIVWHTADTAKNEAEQIVKHVSHVDGPMITATQNGIKQSLDIAIRETQSKNFYVPESLSTANAKPISAALIDSVKKYQKMDEDKKSAFEAGSNFINMMKKLNASRDEKVAAIRAYKAAICSLKDNPKYADKAPEMAAAAFKTLSIKPSLVSKSELMSWFGIRAAGTVTTIIFYKYFSGLLQKEGSQRLEATYGDFMRNKFG